MTALVEFEGGSGASEQNIGTQPAATRRGSDPTDDQSDLKVGSHPVDPYSGRACACISYIVARGELQRGHGTHLRRLRAADRPQGGSSRMCATSSVPDEQPQTATSICSCPCFTLRDAFTALIDREIRNARKGRKAWICSQMQLADRRADHRTPRGGPWGGRGAADRPRRLLPAALRGGDERAHPRHQHRGQIPRTRPAVPLRQRGGEEVAYIGPAD